jgi:hypothetical protein
MVDLTTLISGGITNLPQVGTGIDGLNDVILENTTTLATGDVLWYNGTEWENNAEFTTVLTQHINNLAPLSRQSNTSAIVAMSVGTTAPSSPAVGDLWVDTN